jgi:hypothetical protein
LTKTQTSGNFIDMMDMNGIIPQAEQVLTYVDASVRHGMAVMREALRESRFRRRLGKLAHGFTEVPDTIDVPVRDGVAEQPDHGA